MNRKLTSLIATALFLFVPAWSYAETVVVRDRSGKVIEKKITRGNRTGVRSLSGKLIRVEPGRDNSDQDSLRQTVGDREDQEMRYRTS